MNLRVNLYHQLVSYNSSVHFLFQTGYHKKRFQANHAIMSQIIPLNNAENTLIKTQ